MLRPTLTALVLTALCAAAGAQEHGPAPRPLGPRAPRAVPETPDAGPRFVGPRVERRSLPERGAADLGEGSDRRDRARRAERLRRAAPAGPGGSPGVSRPFAVERLRQRAEARLGDPAHGDPGQVEPGARGGASRGARLPEPARERLRAAREALRAGDPAAQDALRERLRERRGASGAARAVGPFRRGAPPARSSVPRRPTPANAHAEERGV
jgi:hypothetical protein